jgi:hypothetical protein
LSSGGETGRKKVLPTDGRVTYRHTTERPDVEIYARSTGMILFAIDLTSTLSNFTRHTNWIV